MALKKSIKTVDNSESKTITAKGTVKGNQFSEYHENPSLWKLFYSLLVQRNKGTSVKH